MIKHNFTGISMKPTKSKGNGLALFVFLFAFAFSAFSLDSIAATQIKKTNAKMHARLVEENLPPNPTANDISVVQMAPGFTVVDPNDPNKFPQL